MTMMPQEQQVRQLVRETITQAGQIENDRLAQLMPTIPSRKRPFPPISIPRPMFIVKPMSIAKPMANQLALAAMLFLLFLGSWHWFNSSNAAIWPTVPTSVAVTATTTNTPAATQTEARITLTETAVSQQPAPTSVQTPAPPPTPVAAVPIKTLRN